MVFLDLLVISDMQNDKIILIEKALVPQISKTEQISFLKKYV